MTGDAGSNCHRGVFCDDPPMGCEDYTKGMWTWPRRRHRDAERNEPQPLFLSATSPRADTQSASNRKRIIMTNNEKGWNRQRQRNLNLQKPTFLSLTNLILALSYLIVLNLIIIQDASTPAGRTSLVAGAQATSVSNLAPDRIHVIRQPASNPSGSYKQTNKSFKEIFEKFVIHVKENTPIGTKLADVQPRDLDSNQQPLLNPSIGLGGQPQTHFADEETLYKIMPNQDAHLFTIRKDERKIELVNEVSFDYESAKKSYSVLIRATSIYFRYELEVDILVEDENDNRPQLDDFAIVFNNYKNHFPTGPIGRVPATDLDVSDVLRFRVLSGNNARLVIVNETNGDIQLSPWLNSNVPLRAVMDIAVSDGINEAVAKLVLSVNLVTESMLHNSVVLRLDGMTREDFLTRKYDIFLAQLARILGTTSLYSTTNIVVFDVEESHHSLDQQQGSPASGVAPTSGGDSAATGGATLGQLQQPGGVGYRTAYNTHSTITNASQIYVNVSFSARADGNDVEAYLSRQHIEERIYLHRSLLAQSLDAQVAPFQDDICVQEPCQNYQECQVTYKFDKAPKQFLTERNMIFRQIKTTQSYTCLCPPTFTGMRNKLECNLQINQCYTNPCLNGGTCHRHESGYTCKCRGEFFGPRCEHSFLNSTCQSISGLSGSPKLASGGSISNSIQIDGLDYGTSSSKASGLGLHSSSLSSTMCSGKSRCVNLNKFHPHYYQKLASTGSGSLPGGSSSIAAASGGSAGGGFACQDCMYPRQWTNDLCQLRARSFDRNTYISLPSLRRRHRFHLMLQFVTVQNEALLMYNGRYNDRHDFIALEIVDSHLKFSYSLGQPGQIFSVALPSVTVSDGEWHRVTIDYRDRNVTLMVDDCDPVLDEALARLQPSTHRRCSSTLANVGPDFTSDSAGSTAHHMLDLTSPMQLGALPRDLINGASGFTGAGADSLVDGHASSADSSQQQPLAFSHLAGMGANSFAGCMSDLYLDHQLVDLSLPLQEYGTTPGCFEKRSFCAQHSCNGFPCQDSFGSAKCQCGEDRLGKSCEIPLSQEKVRKFSGNSYLTFNPIESQIPTNWQVSLHFRSNNPKGILFKILLDTEASVVLELENGGLRLSHLSRQLTFNKTPLNDGEWHFVELTWSGETSLASLQVDYNANLMVSSTSLGQVAGATMRSVIVGAASSRASSLSANLQDAVASAAPQQSSTVSAVAPEAAAGTGSELNQASTFAPSLTTSSGIITSDDFAYVYSNPANSSTSLVGCIFGLNMSDNGEWWQSPNEERNVERGCPVLDPCEASPCPANSRCQRRGLNQRKCVCNAGFVGDSCVPVCDLQPCQGEMSRCTPASNVAPERGANSTDLLAASSSSSSSSSQNNPLVFQQQQYACECEPNRSGRNCEHQLSPKCPANWWGRPQSPGQNSSICGPCNCDESRGFDGDCDKLTGQCMCKPNHYQPPGSDYCLACDCYLVGSLSTSCNQTSGQCKCRPGVVGRRCDTCASPYAEVTLRGCEVIYDACPKTYSDGIWWDKTQLDQMAVQQCPPSTSTGRATRFCHKTEGWQKANLFDCISNTFSDLFTQYQFLEDNKFQMGTNLAMKIASNLKQALNETISSPSMQLYGSDMYISFHLLHHLIEHESHEQGLNLTHRQDRAYIRNLAESMSYILEPAYAENWREISKRSPNGGAEHLLRLLDNYGKILIESQLDTFTQPFEVATKNLVFGMDTLSLEQLYDLSKWSLPAGSGSSPALSGGSSSSSGFGASPFGPTGGAHPFPSSPPYATDPFEGPLPGPFGGGGSSSTSRLGEPGTGGPPTASGHFLPDGTSLYLDFSATRDGSPSVVIPKYDNYPAPVLASEQQVVEGAHASSAASGSHVAAHTRAIIPLKTLKMRPPKEPATGGWLGAARSRAKREELILSDYPTMRSQQLQQQQAQQRPPVVVYSIFKTLGPLLPANYDNTVQNRLGVLATANSPVVWLTVRPQNSSEFLARNVQPKITYMLKMVDPVGKTRPQCATWDFTSSTSGVLAGTTGGAAPANSAKANSSSATAPYGIKQTGRFTTRGCELKGVYPSHRLRHKYEYVNCSCDHLGAVIVLMDNAAGNYDYLAGDELAHYRDLSLIISLSFSLVLLLTTLFVLTCIRGHSIKSNSNSINKHLVTILALIEMLILYSVLSRNSLNQREYQCKLVAIFLHYFTVSLFFWLLVNAIHFYRMLTELRDINHGPMKFYNVLGYAVPAFFVALAVGLRIEQFGNHLFCWLSIHEPIIWSMFGPICVVALLIVGLFTLALCKSLPLKKMISDFDDPSGLDLIKTHMLINVVKTPLIGVYSILAVYAVNEALEGVYSFPLAVVAKSLLLFVLLCIVDKYIRYNLYVSWLRFKGEKVPFVDDSMMTSGHYGLGGGAGNANGSSQQWMVSMMSGSSMMHPADQYGGLAGGVGHNLKGSGQLGAAGQVLFPANNNSAHQHVAGGGGFQSSCTDIFRPELLAGLSAASTTSRSTGATGTSSASAYRAGGAGDYRRHHHGHRHHHHRHRHHHHGGSDELDGEELDDYGRTGGRRHRSHRHCGTGAKKAHRKHHHHHHGGGHHHHKHKWSHHQDEYEVGESVGLASSGGGDQASSYADYGEHQHRGYGHRHKSGHHHHHHGHQHHNHRQRATDSRQGDEFEREGTDSRPTSRQQRRRQTADGGGGSNHDSLDNILNNDELLASSHSSDQDDASPPDSMRANRTHGEQSNVYGRRREGPKRVASDEEGKTGVDKQTTTTTTSSNPAPRPGEDSKQQQTVPMELLGPSTSGQQETKQEENGNVQTKAKENEEGKLD